MSSEDLKKIVEDPPPPAAPNDPGEEVAAGSAVIENEAKPSAEGLEVSQSGAERNQLERSEGEQLERTGAVPKKSNNTKKKNNKKNRKNKKKGNAKQRAPILDEIDRSVMEVNALLGAPPPAPPPKKENWALKLLRVEPKFLNVANEIRKLFGPDDSEQNRRQRFQPNRILKLRRIMIHPDKFTSLYDFKVPGLSMSLVEKVNDRLYFVFNHSPEYQKMHQKFLYDHVPPIPSDLLMYCEEARRNMHVEALMEISELLFTMDEHNLGNEILENVTTFMQYVAHALFMLSDANVRLDYKYMENRPFHVAMLKYVYLLSNKACHRTALEIAKVLLILDPNDPLALLSLIDVLALRAREHAWLIETVKYFDKQREATLLYNIKYSLALAHYHVAMRKRGCLAEANRLMKDAILAHPQVMLKIIECANAPMPSIVRHRIFDRDPVQIGTPGVNELFYIYVKLTLARWREPGILEWVINNAAELCHNYDTNRLVRMEARSYCRLRYGLFQVWPPEYLRHISVLNGLAKLVLDGPLTVFNRPTCAWDPLFDKGINRYGYEYPLPPPRHVGGRGMAVYSYDVRDDHMVVLSRMQSFPSCLSYMDFKTPTATDTQTKQDTKTKQDTQTCCEAMDLEAEYLQAEQEQLRKHELAHVRVELEDDEEDNNYDYDDDEEAFEKYEQEMNELCTLSDELLLEQDSEEEELD